MSTTRILVVSEGLQFEGVRTKTAFTWREVGPKLYQPHPTVDAASRARHYLTQCVAGAKLSTEDKRSCRRILGTLSVPALLQLERQLKRRS